MNKEEIEKVLEVTGQLMAVADDHEAEILHQLVIRGGWAWRCVCRWVSPTSSARCEACEKERL